VGGRALQLRRDTAIWAIREQAVRSGVRTKNTAVDALMLQIEHRYKKTIGFKWFCLSLDAFLASA